MIIPLRTTWDILRSASQAGVSLISSKQEREKFVECCNKGIIEPPILGMSSHGMAMTLALYNDLYSPLFSQYKDLFVVDDFLSGVAPALERFHDTQYIVQNDLHRYKKHQSSSNSSSSLLKPVEPYLDDNVAILPESSDNSADILLNDLLQSLNNIDDTVLKSIGFSRKTQVKDVLKHSWDRAAARDSNGNAAQLKSMVTNDYFLDLQMEMKSNFILNNKLNYEDGSTKVQNVSRNVKVNYAFYVRFRFFQYHHKFLGKQKISLTTLYFSNFLLQVALLSVRAEELILKEDDENDHDTVKQDNTTRVASPPVVTQVEVLYDIEQHFRVDDENKEMDDPIIRKGVLVGVFEGVQQCGNAKNSLRWHLCDNRAAWEFPYLNSAI